MADLIAAEALANLLLLTPRRVRQLTAEGVIPKTERGRYDLEPAVQGYIRYLKRGGDASQGDQYNVARARLTTSKADIEELKRQKMEGELVPVYQVVPVWTFAMAALRSRLLSIPSKIAHRIRQCANEVEAQALVKREIEGAMLAASQLTFRAPDAPDGDEPDPSDDPDGDPPDTGPTSGTDGESVGGQV